MYACILSVNVYMASKVSEQASEMYTHIHDASEREDMMYSDSLVQAYQSLMTFVGSITLRLKSYFIQI